MLLDQIAQQPYDFQESIMRVKAFRERLANFKRKEPEHEPEPIPEHKPKKQNLIWKRRRDVMLLASRPNEQAEEVGIQHLKRPGSMANIMSEVCQKTSLSVM